jgi:hypothetical protein
MKPLEVLFNKKMGFDHEELQSIGDSKWCAISRPSTFNPDQ